MYLNFHLIPIFRISYIAYIDKTNAYLYDSSMSIEQMIEDINQGGSQASVFLSTENENYKE